MLTIKLTASVGVFEGELEGLGVTGFKLGRLDGLGVGSDVVGLVGEGPSSRLVGTGVNSNKVGGCISSK
jgi:hypothetical protein